MFGLSASAVLSLFASTTAVIPPPTTANATTPAITFAFTVENIPFPPDLLIVVFLSGTTSMADALLKTDNSGSFKC